MLLSILRILQLKYMVHKILLILFAYNIIFSAPVSLFVCSFRACFGIIWYVYYIDIYSIQKKSNKINIRCYVSRYSSIVSSSTPASQFFVVKSSEISVSDCLSSLCSMAQCDISIKRY